LGHAHVESRGDRLQALDEFQVLLVGLADETGMVFAEVTLGGASPIRCLVREESATQRAVGDEPNAQATARVEHAVLGVAVQSEYSDCTAVTGCTAWARSMVAGAASEMPRKRTLPASTNDFIAPQVSSTGTVWSTRCW